MRTLFIGNSHTFYNDMAALYISCLSQESSSFPLKMSQEQYGKQSPYPPCSYEEQSQGALHFFLQKQPPWQVCLLTPNSYKKTSALSKRPKAEVH